MEIDLLLTKLKELEENGGYRAHLAKPAGCSKPLEVFARSNEEWKEWQKYRGNSKERFPARYIVSFAQVSGNKFLFGGIFEIIDRSGEVYEVELVKHHEELIGRLVIEFLGDNKRGTVFKPYYLTENAVISEVYPVRYRGEVFTSIFSINHDYYTMETIFKNDLLDWKGALSKVKGIYLLTDKMTGKHYVGSAYGEGGIWSRWSNYIHGYHGGNKELRELVDKFEDTYFKENFKFSVLEVAGSAVTEEEIIKLESLWKEKLLTRDFGYNSN